MTKPKITVSFKWFEFWIGLYYAEQEKALFLNPLPMLVIRIESDPDEAAWQYPVIAAAYIILAMLLLYWIL